MTAVTGCAGLLIFKQDPDLHFYAVPTLVTLIFAFFVAHSVISLYEVSYLKFEYFNELIHNYSRSLVYLREAVLSMFGN